MVRLIDTQVMLQNSLQTSKNASATARVHDNVQMALSEQQKLEIKKSQETVVRKMDPDGVRIGEYKSSEKKANEKANEKKRNPQTNREPVLPEPKMYRKSINTVI